MVDPRTLHRHGRVLPTCVRCLQDLETAKKAFWVHSNAGKVFEYVVPLHVGAVAVHALKGQNILRRLKPFAAK